jgi:formylglycine-generating enzyme required for sulfatase activity
MQGRRILLLRIILLLFSVGAAFTSQANNLVISNVSLTGQSAAEDYCYIRFDISWENSWRTSSAPNNWDAAWIFAKYRIGSGTWNHVMLNTSGNVAPEGSTLQVPADEVGAFFYRSADGSGTFSKTGVKLRWNYGEQGIGDDDVVDIKVFGLEMVYVPQGAFWVGSTTGGGELGRFYNYPDTESPNQVTSEDEIIIGTSSGNLNYVTGPQVGDNLGPVPASYPKGFNAFYVMKHEITHSAYVDFLNCLTRVQQNTRTQANLSLGISSVTNIYVMVNTEGGGSQGSPIPVHRSAIRCNVSIPANDPITFYCDLNQNNIPNEADDGQHISCVYISWGDTKAFLDWTGLRPISELEFEKSCRGPLYPVAKEYAWGTATISGYSSLINQGTAIETSNSETANSTYRNDVSAPSRAGMFAKPGNTRVQSGATYYGILDMTGNLWERPVNLGTSQGRSYTGMHGNGVLALTGDADVSNWPPNDGEGTGFRGGYWDSQPAEDPMRIAGRNYSDDPVLRRRNRFGGRGVRTAPTN